MRTTSELADALALRLSAVSHRTAETNPFTNLPTRERLLSRVRGDLDGGASDRFLGLLYFAEFDQLLAFDPEAAHSALARLGERIVRAVKADHFVSHVDRATFAIWFASASGPEELEAIAYVAGQQIVQGEAVLTPTLKRSLIRPSPGTTDPNHLLIQAIAALATSRPGGLQVIEPGSVELSRERFGLEQDLARAIEQEQLTMVFQPVVDVSAGRLVGAEALLRWDHPTLGPVSPGRFIPMVERLGLSERYGLWVLNAASREAARWRAEGLDGLKVAVNLSAQQVLDPDLGEKIDRTLVRHGLDSSALELELTETAAMVDPDRTFELFTRLRARRIGLAIDDFGTGYSSLSYLKNLPFTKLKIDREFVTDVDTRRDSRAICKALIELGAGLDLVVLAEGVETPTEVEALRELGCTVFQGYHFSRPLPGDAFVRFAHQPAWQGLAAQDHTHLYPSELSA